MQTQDDKRSIFDWLIFTLIHLVVIGAIGTVGFYVYTWNLGVWVAASATVAGFASCYMFAKEIPGETFMKVILGLAVAANAGYLAHNGAKKIGVDDYNNKQVEKFEKGMAEAGKASSRRIARELRLGAESASKLETIFSDGMATTAAILAFIELACALVIFAISSRRLRLQESIQRQPERNEQPSREEIEAHRKLIDEINEIRAYQTGRLKELEGKGPRQ